MPSNRTYFGAGVASLLLCSTAGLAQAASVDGFESGLPSGTDADGVSIGFALFAGGVGSIAISTTAAPPAAVPGAAAGNTVLQMDVDSGSFAGFVHNFENPATDAWTPRDWSSYDALTLWLYGNNSGASMYIDVNDNRSPGSTTDDAERWTSAFVDDFSGWKQMSFKFAELTRKEIGNGAPNDGLGLTEVHAWALGTLDTRGPKTFFVDDVRVVSSVPEPGTLALYCAGLASVAWLRRRQAA